MATTGSKIQIHSDKLNRLTIKLTPELKGIIVRDAQLRGGRQVNRVVLEILAAHYDRMDLARVPRPEESDGH
jgi:hypothetical protein